MALKKITYKTVPWTRYFLYQAGVLLMPVLGYLCLIHLSFWMVPTCLVAYIGQIIFLLGLYDPVKEVTIPIKYAKKAGWTELLKYLLNIPVVLVSAWFDFFPLAAQKQLDYLGRIDFSLPVYETNFIEDIIVYILIIATIMGSLCSLYYFSEDYAFHTLFKAYKNDETRGMSRRERKAFNRQRHEEVLRHKEAQIARYGENYEVVSKEKEIHVNYQTKKIFIGNHSHAFQEMDRYEILDDPYTRSFTVGGQMKAKNGSVVGRALVGKALFGNIGAVIGAATTTYNKTPEETISTTYHNYSFKIIFKDFDHSTEVVQVGEDMRLLHKIETTLIRILNEK